ncbi:MAG: hypothetical protein ACLVEJ_12795 [Parabacteroides sp.]
MFKRDFRYADGLEIDWQCDISLPNFDCNRCWMTRKKQGFHTCLWQLPYFTPKNRFL